MRPTRRIFRLTNHQPILESLPEGRMYSDFVSNSSILPASRMERRNPDDTFALFTGTTGKSLPGLQPSRSTIFSRGPAYQWVEPSAGVMIIPYSVPLQMVARAQTSHREKIWPTGLQSYPLAEFRSIHS